MVPAAVSTPRYTIWWANSNPATPVIDGGNSYYIDDIRRAKELSAKGIHYCGVAPAAAYGDSNAAIADDWRRTDVVKRLDRFSKRFAPVAQRRSHARPRQGAGTAEEAIFTAVRPALATSSRWCTTASSMA